MGQKTHPYGFRLGYNKPWKSRWYADRDYAELLHEDVKLRRELKEKLKSAGISSIDIERAANIAEAESQKGVRGTARRVRKALTGKQAPAKKGKKK